MSCDLSVIGIMNSTVYTPLGFDFWVDVGECVLQCHRVNPVRAARAFATSQFVCASVVACLVNCTRGCGVGDRLCLISPESHP